MNKFFKRHQKKLLAIFSAFLMIVFFLPSGSKNAGNYGTQVVGTLGKVKITSRERTVAHDEWAQLMRLQYTDPNETNNPYMQHLTLAQKLLGWASLPINQNPDAFMLLEHEARSQGIIVNAENVDSILKNNVLPAIQDDDDMEKIRPAVSDCLMVRNLILRWRDMVKISSPMLDLALAQREQLLTLNVLSFPASDYMAKVATPTAEQIRNQYDSFSDRQPRDFNVITPDDKKPTGDPLGFGYQYRNRLKVDYIGVKEAEVRRAAIASKTAINWEIAADSEYRQNQDYYDGLEVAVPATQPSTRAATQASTAATRPTTAPTTRMAVQKLDDFRADFALHVDVVLQELYDRETRKLAETILKKIDDMMAADYGVWSEAQSSGGASTRPSSSVGPPYDSYEYVTALAVSIQKEFGVSPVLGKVDRFEDAQQLADIQDIGGAMTSYQGTSLSFARYATDYAQDLMAPGRKSLVALAKWKPSMPLENNDDVYIFRITAADPAHTAPLEDVRDRVINDWKLSQAYDMALSAAQAALFTAQTGGLQSAANSVGRPQLLTTHEFNAEEVKASGDKAAIAPLKLKARSAIDIASAAEELLTTPGDHGHRAASLVELYGDTTVAIIEVDEAVPQASDKFVDSLSLAQEQGNDLVRKLCAYDAVAKRMNYIPTPDSGR